MAVLVCIPTNSVRGFSSVQSLSRVRLFATPWIAACQASQSITNSWSLLKLMSIKLVMPSNHLILCRPLLFLPPIPPSRGLPTNKGHKLLLIETLFCALAYSTFRVVLWSRSLTNKYIYYSLVGSTEVGQSWWLFDSAKDSAFFPSLSSATNNISFHPKAGNLICARSQATF